MHPHLMAESIILCIIPSHWLDWFFLLFCQLKWLHFTTACWAQYTITYHVSKLVKCNFDLTTKRWSHITVLAKIKCSCMNWTYSSSPSHITEDLRIVLWRTARVIHGLRMERQFCQSKTSKTDHHSKDQTGMYFHEICHSLTIHHQQITVARGRTEMTENLKVKAILRIKEEVWVNRKKHYGDDLIHDLIKRSGFSIRSGENFWFLVPPMISLLPHK